MRERKVGGGGERERVEAFLKLCFESLVAGDGCMDAVGRKDGDGEDAGLGPERRDFWKVER